MRCDFSSFSCWSNKFFSSAYFSFISNTYSLEVLHFSLPHNYPLVWENSSWTTAKIATNKNTYIKKTKDFEGSWGIEKSAIITMKIFQNIAISIKKWGYRVLKQVYNWLKNSVYLKYQNFKNDQISYVLSMSDINVRWNDLLIIIYASKK